MHTALLWVLLQAARWLPQAQALKLGHLIVEGAGLRSESEYTVCTTLLLWLE
jgi:hypothetical protein